MMKGLVKTFSIVCIILGFLIVLSKGFKLITNSYSTVGVDKSYKQIVATVIKCDKKETVERLDEDRDMHIVSYVVLYHYTVNEKEYEGSTTLNSEIDEGTSITIFYNRDNPTESMIAPDEEKEEDAKQFALYSVYFGGGLILLGIIILLIFRLIYGVNK